MQSYFFTGKPELKSNLLQRFFKPVDNSPLILFRIIFGFLLFYHFTCEILDGAIYHNYIQPPFTFTFIGFEFLQPLPGNGMYFYAGAMILLSLMILAGAWYRFAMTAFALLWTGFYLMQKSGYNNHYYLLLLLCWIMIFMPANRSYSVDASRKHLIRSDVCPQYCLWIFIAQVAIVYFFSAISKLSPDWLSGKFIAIQFAGLSTHRFTGLFYAQKWFQLLICYGGFLFDLLVVPLLLWKRTRNFAFIFSCFFHLFNSYTFRIGIFPFLSVALNLFFLDPVMLRRIFFLPILTVENTQLVKNEFRKKIILYAFLIYVFVQVIIPMRCWFFPGNVFWTEEGYRMSWKMMMRTKSGRVYFKLTDPASGKSWIEDPSKKFSAQHMMWLSISPDIIWQYAQRLKKEFSERGYPNVHVYAIGAVSLNRSTARPLIDTTVDLASVKWEPFRHAKWITDFK